MKIASWNCHFGMTGEKAKKLADFANADIYFVQGTGENDLAEYPEIEEYLGQRKCWYSDHKEYDAYGGGDLGIAIFSRDYTIKRMHQGTELFRYVVPYKIIKNDESEKFYAIHVWTKMGPHYYEEAVIEALKTFDRRFFEDAIMIGDFNFGRLLNPEYDDQMWLADKFNEAVSKVGLKLVDNGLNGESWTYKDMDLSNCLNDCCFVSAEWKVKSLSIGNEKVFIGDEKTPFGEGKFLIGDDDASSDHRPILVELEE